MASVKKSLLVIIISFFYAQAWAISSTLPSTDVRFYRPFELQVDGQAAPVPTETLKGSCLNHSIRDNRSDAWQCQTDNRVLDPCFIKTFVKAKSAICPTSPWESHATLIMFDVSSLPPNNSNEQDTLDMSQDDPWAIALTNGVHCIKRIDSPFSIHGQSVKYVCDNQGFLLGHIQRCELIWKILFLPSRHSDVLKTVEIATAWY